VLAEKYPGKTKRKKKGQTTTSCCVRVLKQLSTESDKHQSQNKRGDSREAGLQQPLQLHQFHLHKTEASVSPILNL